MMNDDPCSKYEKGSEAFRACRQGSTHYESKNHRVEVTPSNRKFLVRAVLIGLGALVIIVILNFLVGKDVTVLAVTSFTMALIVLYYSRRNRELFITVGAISAVVDFLYEFQGIRAGSWDYSTTLRIFNVPLLLPVVYFALGVLVSFLIKFIDPYLD